MTERNKQIVQRYEERFNEWLKRLEESQGTISLDEIHALFTDMFQDGYFEGVSTSITNFDDFTDDDEVDLFLLVQDKIESFNEKIAEAFNLPYLDGSTVIEKATEHWLDGNSAKLKTLLDSEFHRAFADGSIDVAEFLDNEYFAPNGKQLNKTWITVGDERVRDTHDFLDGMTIPLADYFVTYDGDKAKAPSGFKLAQNNANCRCILGYGVAKATNI